jgi:hypothetical protein
MSLLEYLRREVNFGFKKVRRLIRCDGVYAAHFEECKWILAYYVLCHHVKKFKVSPRDDRRKIPKSKDKR